MKKVIFLLTLFLLVLTLSTGVTAVDYSLAPTGDKVVFTDENWAYEKNNGYGYELDEYIGSSTEVQLPWSFAKEYITAVGDYAFNNNSSITSVITTSVLEKIGDYAFNFCSSMKKVVLYESLTSLGTCCFYGNSSLEDINLEDTSVTSIPSYCFSKCGISEIVLPETCTSISDMAFYNCGDLSKITIPTEVTEISDTAFSGCSSLTIYCYTDSYAHQYALDNNIPFVLLDAVRYMLGDADNSGDLDVIDATFVQRYSIGATITCEDTILHADVDRDGDISSIDATFILRHLIHIPVNYPIGEYVTKLS